MNDPERYMLSSMLQRHDVMELIVEFSDELKAMNGRVVDIGCGPGNITRDLLLPSLGDDAIIDGVDISPAMIRFAKEHSKNERRLSFFELDIQSPELPEEFFGVYNNAVSFYCLHWCHDMRVAIENIYKLLRPGGLALVMFLTYHPSFDIFLKLKSNSKFSPYMGDVWNYLPPYYQSSNAEQKMRKDVNEVGFEILHCSNRLKTFRHENSTDFLNLLMSVNPFLGRMPANIQVQFRNCVSEEIVNNYLCLKRDADNNLNSVMDNHSLILALFKKPV